jgi:hypothetical protein
LLLLATLPGFGCSDSNLGQVDGRVLLDGKPMQNIQVTFIPDTAENTYGPSSMAITDADGHYQLVCEEKQRRTGAVVGTHRVTLVDLDAVAMSSSDGHKPSGVNPGPQKMIKNKSPKGPDNANTKGSSRSRLGPRYTEFAMTPLKKQVQLGAQTIDLEVADAGIGKQGRGASGPKRGR